MLCEADLRGAEPGSTSRTGGGDAMTVIVFMRNLVMSQARDRIIRRLPILEYRMHDLQ